jgi:hypothetical protein
MDNLVSGFSDLTSWYCESGYQNLLRPYRVSWVWQHIEIVKITDVS